MNNTLLYSGIVNRFVTDPARSAGIDTMPFTMDWEPERERVLFTVSRDVAQAAIAQVSSCEDCNPQAVCALLKEV